MNHNVDWIILNICVEKNCLPSPIGFVTSSIHIIKEKDRNRNRTKREIYGCVKKILVCFAPSFHPKQMQERSFREGARDPGASL